MQSRQTVDWQMARSNMYGLFGNLLSEQPSAQTLNQLLDAKTVGHIETLFADSQIGSQFRRMADQFANEVFSADHVALDFEGLMRVPGKAFTHPYESSYRSRNTGSSGSKWGDICGPQTQQAERYYQSEGLSPQYNTVDFADHIGAELTFMAHLCQKLAEAEDRGDDEAVSRLEEKQRQFARQHLFAWVDDFSAELKGRSTTPFYQVVADMLTAFIAMEKDQASVQ